MKYIALLIIFAFPFVINSVGIGSEIPQSEAIKIFTLANQEYINAQKLMSDKNMEEALKGFKWASDRYEELLVAGFINGQIYYNLANALYRQGKIGNAVLYYNKAQRLMPRNSDVTENIRLVKTEFSDKELTSKVPGIIKAILFWYFLFNLGEAAAFTMIFYIILAVAIICYVFLRLQWLKPVCYGLGIAVIVISSTLGVKIYKEDCKQRGVVIAQECNVRYGPGKEYEAKFKIHEGAEFIVKDENDEWYKAYIFVDVRQPDDKEESTKEFRVGWLKKSEVGII